MKSCLSIQLAYKQLQQQQQHQQLHQQQVQIVVIAIVIVDGFENCVFMLTCTQEED